MSGRERTMLKNKHQRKAGQGGECIMGVAGNWSTKKIRM